MQTEYILKAMDAALAAGKEILNVYNDPSSDFQVERKADNSPLTLADRKAHETIMTYLQETDYPVLSEEGKHLPYEKRAQWDTLWIVDPLDGTKEFIKRNGEFTVNIALVKEGVPVFGVIYVPVKETLYWGEVATGAYKMEGVTGRAGRSLEEMKHRHFVCPVPKQMKFLSLLLPVPICRPKRKSILRKSERYTSCGVGVCSSSIKICKVCEGLADEYPRFAPTMEWDTAAGHAIAKASGAEIYQAGKEEPLKYNKPDLLNPWFVVKRN